MKLIIDIPEEDYNNIKPFLNGETIKGGFNLFKTLEIIKNGIPLDTHDEEIIATTVESIWGKPPYTELLDKIKDEIKDRLYVNSPIFRELIDYRNGKITTDDVIEKFNRVTRQEVLQILDKYREDGE